MTHLERLGLPLRITLRPAASLGIPSERNSEMSTVRRGYAAYFGCWAHEALKAVASWDEHPDIDPILLDSVVCWDDLLSAAALHVDVDVDVRGIKSLHPETISRMWQSIDDHDDDGGHAQSALEQSALHPLRARFTRAGIPTLVSLRASSTNLA